MARVPGPFLARMVLDFEADQHTVQAGSAVFTDVAGDTLPAVVTGSFRIPRHGVTHEFGTFVLTFTGGTGIWAGSTGRARLDVSQNVTNGNLVFSLNGTARGF